VSIEALIQKALDKGVKLFLVHGLLKYAGRSEVVNELIEPLRQYKAELTLWLQAENDTLNSKQNSEGSSVRPGLDNWNVHSPAGILAATMSGQSDPQRLFRQRGPWLTDCGSIAAKAYHAHHFNCPICIAAGRGSRYGQRCGAGMALWMDYQNAPDAYT
jgi:hypothetical protein